MKPSNVYVIGPEKGPFKIGITNDVDKRLRALQTANPRKLAVHFSIAAEDAAAIEKAMHAKFGDKRLQGEWFKAPLRTIIDALNEGFDIRVEQEVTSLSPESFSQWLSDMKSAGLARSDAECARLLGMHVNSIVNMKAIGADRRTALACRALLHRLEPYA